MYIVYINETDLTFICKSIDFHINVYPGLERDNFLLHTHAHTHTNKTYLMQTSSVTNPLTFEICRCTFGVIN